MAEKILTVVVPAYNAERDLAYNLISLCRPDFLQDIQVIVVDDGSTDATGEIADQWAARYSDTVEVIHKPNGGHGSGINAGIQAAKGAYFKVVDADDWVEETAFSHLLRTLKNLIRGERTGAEEKNEVRKKTGADAGRGAEARTIADAVVSGFYWAIEEPGKRPEEFRRKAEIREPFSGVEYGRLYRFDEITDKIYLKMHGLTLRTAILKEHNIRIDENCYYVDTEYILYPVPYIETVLFIPDFVYQYRIGREGQSISPEKMQKNASCYDKVLHSLLLFLRECRDGRITCSPEKIAYIEGIIARAAAGKIKILLSASASKENLQKLVKFDRGIRKHAPGVYRANRNFAVRLLRLSHYTLYRPAVWMLRKKNKIKQK